MKYERRTREEKERLVGELRQWRESGGTTMDFSRQRGISRKNLNEWKRVLVGTGEVEDADRTVTLVGAPQAPSVPGPRGRQASGEAPVLVSVGDVTVTVFDDSSERCVTRVLALLGVSRVL
jgi:hypothetical protein